MQDWNDLRFFLAVAEHGSTMAASRKQRTSQSTVFRRIAALEHDLGVALFDRSASGYTLTSAGNVLLPIARAIEDQMTQLSEVASREQRQQTTHIRFSAPDVALDYLLPTIGAFRAQNPTVQIELVSSDKRLNLADGEADIALRTSPTDAETGVFGRRVSYERPVIVASRAYAQQHGLPETNDDVADHDFISLISNLAALLGEWFERYVPRERILLQPNNMASTVGAVRAGLGIAVLPQFICDREPDLVAAPLKLPIKTFEMWIVSHERLRNNAHVRALMAAVGDYVTSTTVASD